MLLICTINWLELFVISWRSHDNLRVHHGRCFEGEAFEAHRDHFFSFDLAYKIDVSRVPASLIISSYLTIFLKRTSKVVLKVQAIIIFTILDILNN